MDITWAGWKSRITDLIRRKTGEKRKLGTRKTRMLRSAAAGEGWRQDGRGHRRSDGKRSLWQRAGATSNYSCSGCQSSDSAAAVARFTAARPTIYHWCSILLDGFKKFSLSGAQPQMPTRAELRRAGPAHTFLICFLRTEVVSPIWSMYLVPPWPMIHLAILITMETSHPLSKSSTRDHRARVQFSQHSASPLSPACPHREYVAFDSYPIFEKSGKIDCDRLH